MYKSPIELIENDLQFQIEGEILKAVMNVGVHVDKEELLKALEYDRGQYEIGYADGIREFAERIVERLKEQAKGSECGYCDYNEGLYDGINEAIQIIIEGLTQ